MLNLAEVIELSGHVIRQRAGFRSRTCRHHLGAQQIGEDVARPHHTSGLTPTLSATEGAAHTESDMPVTHHSPEAESSASGSRRPARQLLTTGGCWPRVTARRC